MAAEDAEECFYKVSTKQFRRKILGMKCSRCNTVLTWNRDRGHVIYITSSLRDLPVQKRRGIILPVDGTIIWLIFISYFDAEDKHISIPRGCFIKRRGKDIKYVCGGHPPEILK